MRHGAARARPRRALAQEPHVPERALRRRAAAHRDRARAGRQSEAAALRRADRQPRSVEHDRDHGAAAAHQPQGHDRAWSRPTTRPSSTACAGASSAWSTDASCTTTSEATISVDWGRLRFFLGEVLTNFTRNAGMQFTAIGTVAVTIVLLGAFLYVRDTLQTFGTGVLSQIEIAVYLKDGVDDAAAQGPGARSSPPTRASPSATYVPKRDGLRRMKDVLGKDFDTSLLTANPLPNTYRVRVEGSRPRAGRRELRSARDPRVAKTDYAADTVQKLLKTATVLGRVGIALIALLSLSAAIVIANTIRLTVFARRREIAIMQLVGATNMYIRMPFIAEGMLAGVLGAAVAIGVLALAEHQVVPKLAATLAFVSFRVNDDDAGARAARRRRGGRSGRVVVQRRTAPARLSAATHERSPSRSRSRSFRTAGVQQEPHRRQDPPAARAHPRRAREAARQARAAHRRAGSRRLDRIAARRDEPQHRGGQRTPGRDSRPHRVDAPQARLEPDPARRRAGDAAPSSGRAQPPPRRRVRARRPRLPRRAAARALVRRLRRALERRALPDQGERGDDPRAAQRRGARRVDPNAACSARRRSSKARSRRRASSSSRSTASRRSAANCSPPPTRERQARAERGRAARRDVGRRGSRARGADPREAGRRRGAPREQARRAARLAGDRAAAGAGRARAADVAGLRARSPRRSAAHAPGLPPHDPAQRASTSRFRPGRRSPPPRPARSSSPSYQGDCGNMVAIDHHGGLSTFYCHMSQCSSAVGQEVQRGQAIGAAGATGDATGPARALPGHGATATRSTRWASCN